MQDSIVATSATAEEFYRRLREGDPAKIAALFADPVDWHIPGNEAVAPWLGRRSRRAEVEAFFRQLFDNIDPVFADVRQILAEGNVAIATGEFASRMRKTGKVYESMFFAHFTVENGQIIRYRFLEDSYGLVVAMRLPSSE